MKYIALIHNNPAAWQALPRAERDEHDNDADAFLELVTESGELLGGAVVLANPSNAKTVRVPGLVPFAPALPVQARAAAQGDLPGRTQPTSIATSGGGS